MTLPVIFRSRADLYEFIILRDMAMRQQPVRTVVKDLVQQYDSTHEHGVVNMVTVSKDFYDMG